MSPFSISPTPSEALINLLEHNVIGTPGAGILYQHLQVREKIFTIETPFFVQLSSRHILFGTCCFCARNTINAAREIPSFYIRYFSFQDRFRSSKASSKHSVSNGKLKVSIEKLLDGQGLGVTPGAKYFHYAYVDPKNIRSSRLCKAFGFEEVRKIKTVVFSRMFPKQGLQFKIAQLPHEELPEMKARLMGRYADYTMFSFENLLRDKPYYVLRDDHGEILAGAQVSVDRWRILSMPGFINNALLRVGSALPIVKRIVNRRFNFLAVDGLYFREGMEHHTTILLEHLLYVHQQYNALIAADCSSSLFEHVSRIKLGIVSKLSKSVPTDAICRFNNFSEEEKAVFSSHPAYVSAIDIT